MVIYRAVEADDYEAVRLFLAENGWATRVSDVSRFHALLEGADASAIERFDSSLTSTMRIALSSARIMLLSVNGEVIGVPSAPASTPLFFPATAAKRAPLSNAIHVYFKQ